ncbi:MAG TPA: hypothetical protein VIU38_00965 [Anaerolineales bacterium]
MVGKKAGRKGVSAAQARNRAARKGGRDDRSDAANVRRADKIAAAEKKGSCLPKLGMFILPFIGIAVLLLYK